MAVFVELTTDAFDDRFSTSANGHTSAGAGLPSVRRPMRGLEIKDDTYAYLKLIRADNTPIYFLDSSGAAGYSSSYANFILQSVQEQRMERHQVVESFGDTYLFLFGESPRFLQVQAVLLNSLDFNWEAEFDYNYEKYLRGTKSVEQGARCYLFYDDNVVEGYILNASKTKDAQNPLMVQLNFQFFVTNARNVAISEYSNYRFPIRQSATVPRGVSLTERMNGEQVDALLSNSTGNTNGLTAFNNSVSGMPLRSWITDNKDEYTTPEQPTYEEILAARAAGKKKQQTDPKKPKTFGEFLDDIGKALGQLFSGHGVNFAESYSPFTSDKLGIGPTFLPGGVGIGSGGGQRGALATFGPSPSYAPGGFAGAGFGFGIGVSVKAGFSTSAGAYSGSYPGSSSYGRGRTGPYGYSYGPGSQTPYGSNGLGFGSNGFGSGASFSFGFSAMTGRIGGQSAAFASAQAGVQSGFGSYAYASTQQAARAGGYAGAGAYMGTYGYNSYPGASYPGASGYGPGVVVGGQPTAFAFASFPGTLSNTNKTPVQAMGGASANGWSDSWSWSWPSNESKI